MYTQSHVASCHPGFYTILSHYVKWTAIPLSEAAFLNAFLSMFWYFSPAVVKFSYMSVMVFAYVNI